MSKFKIGDRVSVVTQDSYNGLDGRVVDSSTYIGSDKCFYLIRFDSSIWVLKSEEAAFDEWELEVAS